MIWTTAKTTVMAPDSSYEHKCQVEICFDELDDNLIEVHQASIDGKWFTFEPALTVYIPEGIGNTSDELVNQAFVNQHI